MRCDRKRDRDRRPERDPRGDQRRDRPRGRDTPLGDWQPPRQENPFGPRPRRRKPRDPFARPESAGRSDDADRRGRSRHHRERRRRLELRLEVASDGAVAHLPELPGCTFRAGDPVQLLRVADEHVIEYVRWCIDERIGDLNATVGELAQLLEGGRRREIQVVEAERRDGAPLWLSGQPACMFRSDYGALDDAAVRAHCRFMRAVARRIRLRIASLTPVQRAWKPVADRRSLDETLEHLDRMVWWFCSRLDESLPEPSPVAPDDRPFALRDHLDEAETFLLRMPAEERRSIHLPALEPSADPEERWTHAKVCRRQAEHLREHWVGIPRAVQAAADA